MANVQNEDGFLMSKEENKKLKNIEFYGTSIEDAIQKALRELNVPREAVLIKVVSEEKKGLFGMQGEKPAKIIVNFNEK